MHFSICVDAQGTIEAAAAAAAAQRQPRVFVGSNWQVRWNHQLYRRPTLIHILDVEH